ncbi:MAG: thioredoxin family protein [Bacteroidetes bacterium]|nr:thioredoxin family protein [Bacteroidota bacterium]
MDFSCYFYFPLTIFCQIQPSESVEEYQEESTENIEEGVEQKEGDFTVKEIKAIVYDELEDDVEIKGKKYVVVGRDTPVKSKVQKFDLDFISDNRENDYYDSKSLKQVLHEVRYGKKFYILYFGAHWCIPCRMMRETVFKAYDVQRYLTKFQMTYVDIDDFEGMDIKENYSVNNVPVMIIFNNKGRIIDKIKGSISSTKFSEQLKNYLTQKE